ncbi:MAG: 50S ribosomal protein L17 [Tenuifilaceae bacterium]|nr:50S ribosomal protein L17 [Bacteroidales bacterium]MDI9515493.1 50S ribosomal protein L17 [Bacteroidota bacterium]OQC63635.1 MAG: 50S ribosomal protein L17 [Bacteroidetes bacterium ADurb.Bin008]HNV81150.1 50S ribosomal protein L17 [Tenuifilaceae bacterium]MZP82792.1 50S ribosomal protein L17 [Bacteroidales bacterium]
MRHNKKGNHLGRTASHRKAMMANMATSLIMHKRIKTTVAKAKALRVYVEPLITKSKNDTTHSRRTVFAYLKNKHAVTELFREVAVKVADRPGGYTRILKTGNRFGDNAEMCLIELVDYNTTYTTQKEEVKQKAKRTRRGKGKTGEEAVEKQPKEVKEKEIPAEEVKEEIIETPAAQAEEGTVEEEAPQEETKNDETDAEQAEDKENEAGA